jgi:hypothetical protein
MRKRAAIAIAALAMAAMQNAHAGWVDGNRLREACEARPGTFSEGICYGYIFGTADILFDVSSEGGSYLGFRACFSREVTAGQLWEIAETFFEENPHLLNQGASALVARAFAEAFPCA